jgi:hypothetical protein
MTMLSKTFLTIAVGGLTLGSVVAYCGDNASPVALTAVLPLGAVALGLFLIVFALEKEVAVYDQEQALKGPAPQCNTAGTSQLSQAGSQPTAVEIKNKTL